MSHLGSSRALVAAATLAALLLAGCGSGDQTATTASSTSSSTTTPATSPDPADDPADDPASDDGATAASPRPAAVPACGTGDLRVTLAGEEGAAGSTYLTIRLTNRSTDSCRTGGYGGVSLVTAAQGDPLGAPADRVAAGQRRPLQLAPGESADATLRVTRAGNFSRARCRPARASGLRIYPPNQTESVFLRRATPGCRASGVHLLQLSPYAPAS
ncbi:MAG: DUF4232 domain-containing protein [Nocardioidaceae bacterium]